MFNPEDFRDYCLSKMGAGESFPFGPSTLVFKVCGSIFALASLDETTFRFNVKCDPLRAEELRARFPAVQPGYHMHKRHWNTVEVDGSIPVKELKSFIDDSYALVVQKLPAARRKLLERG